jgi:hypothetical protein
MSTGNIMLLFNKIKIYLIVFIFGISLGFLFNYKPKPQETEISQQEICQNLEAYMKTLEKKTKPKASP